MMAKEMNELEEMFADIHVTKENLFDDMENENSIEQEFFDEENSEEMDDIYDDDDFEAEENDIDSDKGFDEDDEDDDFLELEESDEDDDDLFILKESLREPKLDEDDYLGTVGKPKAERVEDGKFGKPWVKVTLPFIIKNPQTGEKVPVPFVANRSMSPRSRLYPILKGILGTAPSNGFNLKSVEGKKVRVSIGHRTDEKGNVWEDVIAVRPFKKKR